MQAMDDTALLREYAPRHSEPAFETLVARHAPLVYSAALRQMRDPHLAAEVTPAPDPVPDPLGKTILRRAPARICRATGRGPSAPGRTPCPCS
jgi:hypothetical protein